MLAEGLDFRKFTMLASKNTFSSSISMMTGGMTNEHCPDWMQDMIKKITDMKFELPRQSEDFDGHVSHVIYGTSERCAFTVFTIL